MILSKINNKSEIKGFINKISFEEQYNLSLRDKCVFFVFIFFVPILFSLIIFTLSKLNLVLITNQAIVLFKTYVIDVGCPTAVFTYGMIYFRKQMFANKIFGYFLCTLIYSLLQYLFFSIPFPQSSVKMINAFFMIVCYGLFVFYFFYKNNSLKQMFKLVIQNKFILFIIFFVVGILSYYLLNFVFRIIQNTYETGSSNNQTSVVDTFDFIRPLNFILMFIFVVLLAPIIEELLYRYIFQNIFDNKWYSIIISTIFFAFIHVQHTYDWEHFLTYLPLGIVSGTIYKLLKNINVSISIHMGVNLVAFIIILLQTTK